jgi:hypothetical protein
VVILETTTHCRSLLVIALGVGVMMSGCKDGDPCDPGQREQNGLCYPIAQAGSSGAPGAQTPRDGGDADAGGDPPGAMDSDFGRACADTVGSSDCGDSAPICAPFPTGNACTQILCQAGEANAGVCPLGWQCLSSPGNPSVCFGM